MRHLSRIHMVAAVTVIAVSVAGCARFDSGARADDAWTDRLNGQAQVQAQEAARAEQARQAWSQRLVEQARAYHEGQAAGDRADQAWSDRLNGLAGGGMSERASQAWTDRLSGLAELYAADER